MKKYQILIIDDNASFLELFQELPGAEAFDIFPVSSGPEALSFLSKKPVDVIVSDLMLPEMSGTQIFKKAQDLFPDIPFILITAFGSVETAIQTVKQGAFHYFEKPINDKLDLFWTTVREAIAKREMLHEIAALKGEHSLSRQKQSAIIGRSDSIREVLKAVREAAQHPVNVLIRGETGTGKALVAHALHNQGERQDRLFFEVNCAEFAPGVLESELFGHEKGAFTGAVALKKGIFEIAHNGTLFLDEIAEIPIQMQPKLLRALESKDFKRMGGEITRSSNFRLIAATNRDIEKEVAAGNFREDLLFRINLFTIHIPPLRQRKEDIPLIAEYYLQLFVQKYQKSIQALSESALLALRNYDWPGNVRELINVIERAVITCREEYVTTSDLPFENQSQETLSTLNLKEMEGFYIDLALKRTGGNKTEASRLLGISRKTLIEKVKKYE